jgi:methylmalonyl-CoA/ethylmalonyl-CoA epimerase
MSVKKPKLPPLTGIGVAVKDVDKAVKYYSETFGIGPFRTIMFSPDKHWVKGKPFPVKAKIAFASLGGSLELELLEPLSDGPLLDFINTQGEGLNHLGFNIDNFDEWMSYLKQKGIGILAQAESDIEGLGYIRSVYIDSQDGKPGNTLIELTELTPHK